MTVPRVLNRQRILLELADLAQGSLCLRKLTLLAFVVANETSDRGGDSFYAFIPHRDGPMSFTLHHEVSKLAENDLIAFADGDGALDLPRHLPMNLVNRSNGDVRRVIRQLGSIPTDDLAARIAKRYPAYTSRKKCTPKSRPSTLHTKGYEGLSVDHYLGAMVAAGVRTIIDVRNHPVSRRFGFHKGTLSRLAGDMGMSYYHFPNVGIPSSERRDVGSDDELTALLSWYGTTVLVREEQTVREIAELTSREPSVLMCSEQDSRLCHRSRLAEAVVSFNDLSVVHI